MGELVITVVAVGQSPAAVVVGQVAGLLESAGAGGGRDGEDEGGEADHCECGCGGLVKLRDWK